MADRVLIVVRHAKSSWDSGLPDVQRPLGERGRRDAPAAGRWIADHGYAVDAAVISPSARTRETWALLAKEAGIGLHPMLDRGIYLGEAEDLADALRGLSGLASCAVLVGHSPGCVELVDWLTRGQGDASAQARLHQKYPTSAVAVVELPVEWSDLTPGAGRLLDFAIPRG